MGRSIKLNIGELGGDR